MIEAILVAGLARRTQHGWQFNQSLGMKLTQQITAGDLPEQSVGLTPIPNLTEPSRQMRPAQSPFLGDQLADQLQIRGLDPPPSDCHLSDIIGRTSTRPKKRPIDWE